METISRGAQFKGALSMLGLVGFVVSLVFVIAALTMGEYLMFALVLPVTVFSLSLFLGIRGMQVDFTNRRIREYRQLLWIKSGEWKPLENYNGVHLVKDSFGVRLYGGTTMGYGVKVSTYDVLLIDNDTENSILMSEFAKHPDAVKFMEAWASKLSLEARDTYRELQASAVRNRRGRR
jgi:hypothetical protein